MDDLLTDAYTPPRLEAHPMHPTSRRDTIRRAITGLIPGGVAAQMTVKVIEAFPPGTTDMAHTWDGTPAGLAERIDTALDAHAAGTLDAHAAGTPDTDGGHGAAIGPLAVDQLEVGRAAWYPPQKGDVVHLHYVADGREPAWGETYVITPGSGGPGQFGMLLLLHSPVAGTTDPPYDGVYGTLSDDDPLGAPWFELGPQAVTVVRGGQVIPHQPGAPAAAWAALASDLDRCEHGRHIADMCIDCGGLSGGNPLFDVGDVIGYDLHGATIHVPDPGKRHDPAAWRARPTTKPQTSVAEQVDESEADACHVVQTFGGAVLLRGQGDMTPESAHHFGEVIAAARRRYAAEHPDSAEPTPAAAGDAGGEG